KRPRPGLDPLAGRVTRDVVPVVDGLKRAEAADARPTRNRRVVALADSTAQPDCAHLLAPSHAEPTGAAYFANTPFGYLGSGRRPSAPRRSGSASSPGASSRGASTSSTPVSPARSSGTGPPLNASGAT